MGDYSLSFVRAASSIILIAALSLYRPLGLSSAAENAKSSEDASNTVEVRESPEVSENPAAISKLPAYSTDAEIRSQLAELTTRLEQSPDDVDALVARGRLYFRLKDIANGQADLANARRLSADNPDVWHFYGQERLTRGLTQEAIEAFEKAAGLGSKDPALFLNLGTAYYTLGKPQEAIANYTRAIKIKPGYGQAYIVRALVWDETAELDKAIADFDKAIELGYRTWLVFYNRGRAYQGLENSEQAIANYTFAIQKKPDHAESHFGRAQMRLRSGDFKNAIADFDRVVEIEPGSAFYRSTRGMAYFDQGDFDRGTADVLEAIRLNTGDVGVNYQLRTNKDLSSEALKHGEQQLRNMLRDRPSMAQFVSPQDMIWQWTVRKFAGEDLGAPIDWDPTHPGNVLATSFRPGSKHARIQLSQTRVDLPDTRQCTFDELWQVAVFELHNITSSPTWSDLDQQVIDGKLKRDDYIVAVLESEHLATQRTRAFYLKHYLPWVRAKGMMDTSPRGWYCESFFPDRQSRLAEWRKDSRWPLYSAHYDYVLAKREYLQSNYDEALKLLTAVVAKDKLIGKEDLQAARYLLGQSYEAINKLEQAINEYSAVLDVAPNDSYSILARAIARYKAGLADAALEDFERFLKVQGSSASAYSRRGIARSQLGQFDAAMADFDEAIGIDPKSVDALSARASEHSRRGDHDAALNDLATAIEAEPNNADLYVQRGYESIYKKDFTTAVAHLSEAVRLAPQDPRGFAARANAWYNQGELNKSLIDWDVVLRLTPADTLAYLERGNVNLLTKRYSKAFVDASKAIELAPELPDAYALRAELLLESDDPEFKRPDAAIKDAQRSCELTQWQSPYFLALLASAYAATQDYTRAVEWQTKALLLSEPTDRRSNIKLLEQYRAQKSAAENPGQ